MKAYQCDVCKGYYNGYAAGVFYDNASDSKKGDRYDLCPSCSKKVLGSMSETESDIRESVS